ncbi:lipase member I [Myotis myotis]|uniref:lipase member I n=1 Tax=Myotis myotis TaxID=51298 RepID=UPI00174C360A|nr:lipase member I [Myotis myotis]
MDILMMILPVYEHENKRPCLEFTKLSMKDSFSDLFNPQVKMFLLMYPKNNLNCPEPLLEQDDSLNVKFNTSKKTVWLIHGYRPLSSIPSWLPNFIRILNHHDVNIVVVNWIRGATTLIYSRAVKNTRKVAVILSEYIQKLLKHGASLDNFHFIGMSLGAHISGFVGKIFQGQLGRITGLDPAGPQFYGKPSNDRLHYTDAKFVDVIHSDTDGLGILEPVGHIDFYPNGGEKQPGCPTTIFGDYKAGSCMDCDNFKKKSCPRLGHQAELWKDVLEERMKRSLRTTVFLDTTGINPFCTYYFVLSVIVDNTTMDGYITFKLLNRLGRVEVPWLYKKNKSFYKLQEAKILAQFLNDVVNISRIGLVYYQDSNHQCCTCQYSIQRLMLKSLTYPERPPLCMYDIVLKENEEVFLNPCTCIAEEI